MSEQALEISDAEHARDVVSAFLIRLSELRPRTQRIMALDGEDYVLDAQDLRVLLGEVDRLTTVLDAVEKALNAPTHLHRYNKDIHSSDCFACRLREWVVDCLQNSRSNRVR